MKGKKIITPEIEKKIITLRKKKIGAPLIAKKLGLSRAPVGKYLKIITEKRIIPRLERKDYKSWKKFKRYKKRPKIHNIVHKINPKDRLPIWAKYKIQFSTPSKTTISNIPKKFQGIQFFKDKKEAEKALDQRKNLTEKLLKWNYMDMRNIWKKTLKWKYMDMRNKRNN